jgi:hypothetical protein
LDSLTFAIVLVVLVAWVAAWSLIGSILAASRGQDPVAGLVQGLTFGPIGVLFVVMTARREQRAESPKASAVENRDRVNTSKRNLYQ